MKQVTRNLRAIFALVLSSLILATSMLLVGPQGKKANAAESEGPYEKLYYITDYYYPSINYVNNVILPSMEEAGLGEDALVYDYISMPDFMNEIQDMQREGYFSQIVNSYIIFEMRQELLRENYRENALFIDALNMIFFALKEQNCKIMIIFGTDEQALAMDPSYTEFLTYADIVINTNVIYTFVYNYIIWVNRIYGESIFDVNVFLSPGCCDEGGQIDPYRAVFKSYLIPFCIEYFGISAAGADYYDILNKYFLSDNHYIQWANYREGNWGDYKDLEYPVGFGVTYSESDKAYHQWECIMYNLRKETENEFPIFVLNESGTKVAGWIQNGTKYENIFYSGDIAAILEYYIPLIMHDFIVGEDLTQYDNWPGACDITFKPIFSGEDDEGWMEYPEVFLCWQVVF